MSTTKIAQSSGSLTPMLATAVVSCGAEIQSTFKEVVHVRKDILKPVNSMWGLLLLGTLALPVEAEFPRCTEVCKNDDPFMQSKVQCKESCTYADGVATNCGAAGYDCRADTGGESGDGDGGSDGGESGGGGMSVLTWNRPTWQSSTDFGGTSGRAVDNNADGIYWNGSVTHSALQDHPEWGVWIRPGRVVKIIIWNRTDCCGDRLSGANVWIRRASNDHTWDHVAKLSGNKARYDVNVPNANGRVSSDAVAIVRDGRARYLSLAEVLVWGWPNSPF
ncbi:MAG: hypothetical protein ACRD1T_11225 [Acidimicrobiia bacterium]